MQFLKSALILLLLFVVSGTAVAQNKPFINWNSLSNPFLSYPDWSIKDAAMAYREGTFYVFFSAFYQDRGRIRSHVVEVSTRDFKNFSQPIFNLDGAEEGWIGMCSPDVQQLNGKYVMTFNSWGDKPGKPNQLFYITSDDLVHWSARHNLALNLTGAGSDQHAIDAALAVADGGYYLAYKEQRPGTPKRPRMAFSTSLDGPFHFVSDGLPVLLMRDGKDNGLLHENYEFFHTNHEWYLLTTDYIPQAPYLYKLEHGSKWLRWTRGYTFNIPMEKFNTVNVANASAIYDWRQYDGYYYLIYAGHTEGETYARRGWNRLGLARSKDLIHWSVPGASR
ncbi:MAG: hypothetical protein BGO25_00165 [Acidobacteriales bacterium 59-55]|nr:hypothetical protein [Terriglobales bacterium]OJV39690.1 MAG: hypothetical protein BGO25_00165 [Acidobacteriales bacterium 59-55]